MGGNTHNYTIFTDGSGNGRTKATGGYGAVILDNVTGEITQLSGQIRMHNKSANNNRFEMLGAIMALESVESGSTVTLFTDSAYVDDFFNGRLTRTGRTENTDLFGRADEAAARCCLTVRWVKGHAGNLMNEICDKLAIAAMEGKPSALQIGVVNIDGSPITRHGCVKNRFVALEDNGETAPLRFLSPEAITGEAYAAGESSSHDRRERVFRLRLGKRVTKVVQKATDTVTVRRPSDRTVRNVSHSRTVYFQCGDDRYSTLAEVALAWIQKVKKPRRVNREVNNPLH